MTTKTEREPGFREILGHLAIIAEFCFKLTYTALTAAVIIVSGTYVFSATFVWSLDFLAVAKYPGPYIFFVIYGTYVCRNIEDWIHLGRISLFTFPFGALCVLLPAVSFLVGNNIFFGMKAELWHITTGMALACVFIGGTLSITLKNNPDW